jgi:hypothetical protein
LSVTSYGLLATALLCCSLAQANLATYDFESVVNNTTLVGQDNWVYPLTPPGGAFDMDVRSGTGSNTTQIAMDAVTSSIGGYASRINDGAFSYTAGFTQQTWIVQADMRWAANGLAAVHLGNDLDGDGSIEVFGTTVGASGNLVGYEYSGNLLRRDSATLTVAGTTVAAPASFDVGDWVRLRLEIDWTKNYSLTFSGVDYYFGAGWLFYMNLTDGETVFTPVPGLQDVNLGTSTRDFVQSFRYAQVDGNPTTFALPGVYIRVDQNSGGLDNLALGVPEPSVVALAGLGCLLCLRRRK